jgi:hypothetical protein
LALGQCVCDCHAGVTGNGPEIIRARIGVW